jgi:hypothetical protein
MRAERKVRLPSEPGNLRQGWGSRLARGVALGVQGILIAAALPLLAVFVLVGLVLGQPRGAPGSSPREAGATPAGRHSDSFTPPAAAA